jgi:DNA-binding NarL/FixJ family response regulator
VLITIDESFRLLSQHLRDLTGRYRILVATANRPYALALASLFALQGPDQDCPLIGIASTREEALSCLDATSEPVLAFVSEQLEECRGLDLVADLKQRSVPESPIATVFTLKGADPTLMREALASPADVVLTRRSLDLNSIANAMQAIQAGERFVDPFIPYAICHRDPRDAHALSDRERMVLTLLCDGMTNKEIADQLSIAETTARGHVQSIMRKLNVKDRTAAAVEGIRRHWVD